MPENTPSGPLHEAPSRAPRGGGRETMRGCVLLAAGCTMARMGSEQGWAQQRTVSQRDLALALALHPP